VIVAYDQSVRENAISNPAPTAGANIKIPSAFELSVLLPCAQPCSFVEVRQCKKP